MSDDLVATEKKTGVVAEWLSDDPVAARRKILQLQAEMLAAVASGEITDTVKELPLRHSFIEGGYSRELTIPAGTLIIGKIHRYSCFNFVTEGRMTVLTEDGVKEIVAPATFTSGPGMKRVGYAHEKVVWTTVHVTDETDVDKIEDALTFPEFHALEVEEQRLLG